MNISSLLRRFSRLSVFLLLASQPSWAQLGPLLRDHPDGYIAVQNSWRNLDGRPDYHKIYHQYGSDLRVALSQSRDGIKRGVMVVFSWANCPFTQAMRDLVFNDEETQSYVRSRMIMVNVDVMSQANMMDMAGRELSQKRFAETHQVTATPTFFFYDTSGVLRYRHHGAIPDRQLFHTFARLVADGVWDESVVEKEIQARHGVVRR